MSQIHAEESMIIDAPAAAVYAVIADYHIGHAAILPKPYFEEMQVVRGGVGAGTELIVKMNVYGTKATYNMQVSEPEPGRVISETDAKAGVTTTFMVEPTENDKQCRVTIRTVSPASSGIAGVLEKLIQPTISRRIFRAELKNLGTYMRQQ